MLEPLGLTKSALIGGAIGALISLQFANGLGKAGQVGMFFSGLALAGFLTPAAGEYFDISVTYYGGVGLLIGLFGMSVVSAIIKAIPDLIKAVSDRWKP